MEKGGWIAVIVALITTAGVVISKYLEVAKPVVAAPEKPVPTPTPGPVNPDPTPPAVKPERPAVQPAVEPVAEDDTPAPAPVKRKPVQIGGTWIDTGGLSYDFEQAGSTFRIGAVFGQARVYGQGAIVGRELRWTYTNSVNNPGQCAGELAPGDAMIMANCQQMTGPPYTVQLARPG